VYVYHISKWSADNAGQFGYSHLVSHDSHEGQNGCKKDDFENTLG